MSTYTRYEYVTIYYKSKDSLSFEAKQLDAFGLGRN